MASVSVPSDHLFGRSALNDATKRMLMFAGKIGHQRGLRLRFSVWVDLPADGIWLPVRPSGLRRIPLAALLVHYNKRSFAHALVDESRVRSIIAIKHEAHVTPVLIRNFLSIFMHLLDVQASD
jgi:hypothetical protein